MGLFARKSRREQVLGLGAAALGAMAAKRGLKVGAGLTAGALGVAAASAAVSSMREQETA